MSCTLMCDIPLKDRVAVAAEAARAAVSVVKPSNPHSNGGLTTLNS